MDFTFKQLKKKTVAELREIASGTESEAVKGYTQMNKEHLLIAICDALHIDHFVHHRAAVADKSKIKQKIKEFKRQRDEAMQAHDHEKLKAARTKMRHLKKK